MNETYLTYECVTSQSCMNPVSSMNMSHLWMCDITYVDCSQMLVSHCGRSCNKTCNMTCNMTFNNVTRHPPPLALPSVPRARLEFALQVGTHTHTHAHTHAHMQTHTHTRTHTHTHTHTRTNTRAHTHTHTHAYAANALFHPAGAPTVGTSGWHTHTHTHTRTHTHMHTCTHTYIHTYTHILPHTPLSLRSVPLARL